MAQSSSRRGPLIGLGSLLVVGGLIAGVVLWNLGGERRASAVEGFARAPVGCDTTLDFVETGEYFVFIETAGQLDGVRGDCNIEGSYDVIGAAPGVDITVVDPAGVNVDINRSFVSVDYDERGFVGSAAFALDISETNDHVMRVESNDGDRFVVAIGRDPSDGVAVLRGGAAAAGILGLLVGLMLILLGARRSKVTVASGPWTSGAPNAAPVSFMPVGQAPQGPPVYGQQVGPPQYGGPHSAQPPPPEPPAPPPSARQQTPAPHYDPPSVPVRPSIPVQPTTPPQPGPPSIPGRPPIPGQPPAQPWWAVSGQPPPPQVPANSAGSTQPIDWSPQGSADFAEALPAECGGEDEDEDPYPTQQRPVPPPN
jgi:hypothetical protein